MTGTVNSLHFRLRQAMKAKGMGFAELAAATGMSASGLKKWGTHADPSLSNFVTVAGVLNVAVGWLAQGDEETVLASALEPARAASNVVAVPILSVRVSAGHGVTAEDDGDAPARFVEVDRTLLSSLGLRPAETSALTIRGDSAHPTLSDGELVLVDRAQTHPQDGGMYIIGVDGDVLVKRVQRLIDGGLLLKSDNPAYEAQRVSAADAEAVGLRIIGRVKYALRSV